MNPTRISSVTVLTFAMLTLAISTPAFAQGITNKGKFAKAEHRGFAIPQIDLTNHTELQTIIRPDPSKYMGHPTSVLLDDGRTMLMFYLDQHGRGRMNWQRSRDGGRTWSGQLPLPEGWDEPVVVGDKTHDPWLEVPIAYKVNGADGRQRICMYTSGRSIYPARYSVSEDDGKTFSPLKPLKFDGKDLPSSVVLFADLIPLRDGTHMATWHTRGEVFVADSPNGVSFGPPRTAATYPDAHPCEGCLLRSPDGKTIALLLRENTRTYNSLITFSTDEGQTWTTPKQMPDALTGDRHQHTYLADGRLFISFRDVGAESPTDGDWVGWVGTYEDLVSGAEGQYRVRLKDNFKGRDCAYPTQHLLPDGTLFAATYGGWTEGEPNYLIAYHIKMAELDAMAKKAK